MELTELFGTEKVGKILLRLAPPVMLAQLIQALYNIVDSLFVGKYADSGLTALSIVYPLQLLMIALAVGTGVGVNTVMAARLGIGRNTPGWPPPWPLSCGWPLPGSAGASCPSMPGCPPSRRTSSGTW